MSKPPPRFYEDTLPGRDRDADTQPTHRRTTSAARLEVLVEVEAGAAPQRPVMVFDTEVVRIGSHPSNDCVLTDPQVSRLHCQIRQTGQGWQVADSGSLNGTMIRGVRVRDADLSLPECTLELGNSRLRVRAREGKAADQPGRTPFFGRMYGASPVMARLYDRIERVARTDSDVLIEGESGTGKELIAAEIVRRSARADKPLGIVDCGAISETLFDSEVFGHVKGAFTGADQTRVGVFESAHGGTVFLDEIGELPLASQAKLLRALAAREIRRTGENQARRIDVRVIAATNRRLDGEVNRGAFREDLYFRLGVLRIESPPLRERLDDLPILVGAFLQQFGAPEKLAMFDGEVMDRMRSYAWPGNVRELHNYVEQLLTFEEDPLRGLRRTEGVRTQPPPGEAPGKIDLDVAFRPAKSRIVAEFERAYLAALIGWANGNVSRAARKANLDRMYLHRLLQRYGLRAPAPLDD